MTPEEILRRANEFVKSCGFKIKVFRDEQSKRIALYSTYLRCIGLRTESILLASENYNLTIDDYLSIVLSRELGRFLDEGLHTRSKKIERIFNLIKKGYYSERLIEKLADLANEEEGILINNGEVFIKNTLLDTYHEINERYKVIVPDYIKDKAYLLNIEFKTNQVKEKLEKMAIN